MDSDIKKLEPLQFRGVPTGTPNIAIIMELGILSMGYKIQERKLMECQRLMKMNEERLTMKVTMKAIEMGSRNLVDDARGLSWKNLGAKVTVTCTVMKML